MGATISCTEGTTPLSHQFSITFLGKAGHTAKAGTAEDDGIVSVFPDAARVSSILLREENPDQEAVSNNDAVRINIGSLLSNRRGERIGLTLAGEARYAQGDMAREVLGDLQQFVESYGGQMTLIEENGAYSINPKSFAVQRVREVLYHLGYTPKAVPFTYGISDANNWPNKKHTPIVLSDGGEDPHTPQEHVSIESVVGIIGVIRALIAELVA